MKNNSQDEYILNIFSKLIKIIGICTLLFLGACSSVVLNTLMWLH
jgi:hypothetical protein